MAAWLDAVLDTTGMRPASVTWAAMVSAVAGGVTLIAGVVVVGVLFESRGSGAVNGAVILAWTVAATQVAAAVLLILGAGRLAVGAGRTMLVAGATLQLLLCAVYVLYTLTVVAQSSADPSATVVLLTTTSLAFAVMAAGGLILALRPMTAEYLTLCGHDARPRRL